MKAVLLAPGSLLITGGKNGLTRQGGGQRLAEQGLGSHALVFPLIPKTKGLLEDLGVFVLRHGLLM